MNVAPLWWPIVALFIWQGFPGSEVTGRPLAEGGASIDVVLCPESMVVYSISAGHVPALCGYSPSEQAVLWRRVTSHRVERATQIDRGTFAIIENGELQFCSLATGEAIRRVALASLPWAPLAQRENDGSQLPGDREDIVFHSPRVTPSGICVWRGAGRPAGWGLIDHDQHLRCSAPEGRFIGYAPNGRPLLQAGRINPRVLTIRDGDLLDATGVLFRRLRQDYPDMMFSLFPVQEFSRPGKMVIALRRRDAPPPARGRIHPDRVVVLHIDSGSFATLRSKPRHGFYENWAVHDELVYRYSTSIDREGGDPKRKLWMEAYALASGVKRAERDLVDLDANGILLLRGFTSRGDPVFVHQVNLDPAPPNHQIRADSQLLLLDGLNLTTQRNWPLSVDGAPVGVHEVQMSPEHGILQTFGNASVLNLPSRGTRRHVMGVRAFDPYSGEERWHHAEHLLLEKFERVR